MADEYSETIRRLFQHITVLRSMKEFSTCPILFVVERNYGWSAPVTCAELAKIHKENARGSVSGIFFYHDINGKLGFQTDNASKANMAQAFDRRLKSNDVLYYEGFFNINDAYTPETMKYVINKQLTDYKRKVVPGADVSKQAKVFYGGKPKKDDMAICLQMNCYLHLETYTRKDLFAHSLEMMNESIHV